MSRKELVNPGGPIRVYVAREAQRPLLASHDRTEAP